MDKVSLAIRQKQLNVLYQLAQYAENKNDGWSIKDAFEKDEPGFCIGFDTTTGEFYVDEDILGTGTVSVGAIYFKNSTDAEDAITDFKEDLKFAFWDLSVLAEIHNNTIFGKLTLNDVSTAVNELFAVRSAITTLDVKERLRHKGFWALQDEVSKFMQQIVWKDHLYTMSTVINGKCHLLFSKT